MFRVQFILQAMWTGEMRELERKWINDGLHRDCFSSFIMWELFNIEKNVL